jgi:hypothetical protein
LAIPALQKGTESVFLKTRPGYRNHGPGLVDNPLFWHGALINRKVKAMLKGFLYKMVRRRIWLAP